MLPALAIGGSMLVSAGLNYLGSRGQASAAKSAAKASARAGQEGSALIANSEADARANLLRGASGAQAYEEQAFNALNQARDSLGDTFSGERQAGSDALAQLRALILGGDDSALTRDPGYQFRLAEGEKALARAASAGGSFGSGRNLKDFMRFGQGLASQERSAAVDRLLALQDIGGRANLAYAGMNQGLYQNQAGILENRAGIEGQTYASLANLATNTAANRANSLNNTTSNVNNYNLQAANANASGLNTIGQTASQMALMATLFGGGGGGGGVTDPRGGF